MAPVEVTLLRSLPWLLAGLLAALLARPARKPLTTAPLITVFTVHLSAMLALVLAASLALEPLTSAAWRRLALSPSPCLSHLLISVA